MFFLVLIQSDKGGGISGAIGGGLGGANSLLGAQDTANILTRGTVIFGCVFFALCIILSFLMSHQSVNVEKSLLQKRAEKQSSYSPASVLNNGNGLPDQESRAGCSRRRYTDSAAACCSGAGLCSGCRKCAFAAAATGDQGNADWRDTHCTGENPGKWGKIVKRFCGRGGDGRSASF